MPLEQHDGHGAADSAGTPWQGRSFGDAAPSDDDGSAAPALIEILRRFREGEVDVGAVVDVIRASRLLIPLVAELAEAGVGRTGLRIDKSADLSIVTVAGPDGRGVMPVFSSVDSMRRWKPMARPVPADAVRVGLAAASEHTDLVVLDPMSETEFVIRRPAVWAIAQQLPWVPSYLDRDVAAEFANSVRPEQQVLAVSLAAGDPGARLAGPELVVTLELAPGLDQSALSAVVARLQQRWSASEVIAARVDSVAVRLLAADSPEAPER